MFGTKRLHVVTHPLVGATAPDEGGIDPIDPSSLTNVAHRWWAGNVNEGGAAPSNGAVFGDATAAAPTWKDLIGTADSTGFGISGSIYRSADAGLGGQPAAEFNGSTTFLSMAFTVVTPVEFLFTLRFRSLAAATFEFIMDARKADDSQALYFYRDNDAAENDWAMGDLATNVQGGTVDTSPHCVRLVRDGTARSITVDGTVVASGTSGVGDQQLDDILVGCVTGGSLFAPVTIADLTVIDGRISDDEWVGYRQWAYEEGYTTPAP